MNQKTRDDTRLRYCMGDLDGLSIQGFQLKKESSP